MTTSWAQEETTVSIDPASQEVWLGTTATTDVLVEDVVNLYGAAFEITFDPTLVEVVDADLAKPGIQIQPGDFLSPDWLLDNTVDNDNGTIAYALSQMSPSLPQSGDGVLAIITWRGKAAGTSPIHFTNVQLGAPGGVPIPADTQDGQITVEELLPAVELTKEADPTVVNVGDTVDYTITADNTGNSDLTSVTVDDHLPGCTLSGPTGDDGDGVLEPGETWTYTCSITAGDTDIENTATIEATDELGGTVGDSDTASVDVIHPDVELTKEADPTVANVGDTVDYTISVENTGDANLTNVTVDDHLPGCTLSGPTGDDGDGVLEPGETWTYTCSITAGDTDIQNTATVQATDEAGGTVDDSDTAFVDVIHPDVELTKEADPTVVNVGDTVDYTISVENTGDANLTDVTVDDHLPGCTLSGPTGDDGDGVLEPGETWTYTCSITAGDTDIQNTATVQATDEAGGTVGDSDTAFVDVIHPDVELTKEADPTVVNVGDTVDYTIAVENTGDANLTDVTVDDHLPGCTLSGPSGDDGDGVLEPGETWTYTCSITAGNTDIQNTATVEATDEAGGTVDDSDTASVRVIHPDVELTKEADPTVVYPGDTVNYTIAVENTGDADLTDVTVDDHLPGCTLSGPTGDDGDGVLEPEETWTYTCSITAGDTDIQNTATVQATDELGGTVDDSDTAFVDVIHPNVELTKEADPTVVNVGDTVDYTISVENTGDANLTDVTVDDHLPGCTLSGPTGDDGDGVLEPGETWTYTCSITAGEDDIENTATVEATDELGGTVGDSDTASVDVIHPAIEITKEPDHTVLSGSSATFTITVANTGDVGLTDVTVTDALVPNCEASLGSLAVGESSVYTCVAQNVTADFTNSATATGSEPTGGSVSDTDTANVDVIHPAIEITKEPDQMVLSGSSATFTITVANTGDVDLTNVTVTDALAPDCDENIGSLPAGQSTSYTCVVANVTADFTNSATATGTDPIGGTVSDTDTADVDVIHPDVELTKEADPTVVNVGDTVNYTISVENSGDANLTNVTVDDHLPGCTLSGPSGDDGDGVLEPGETWTYSCSITAGDTDIQNTATVQATDELGGTVNDSDLAFVNVIHPDIEFIKEAGPAVVNVGDTVDYTITVKSKGGSNLRDVTVDDDLPGCVLSGPSGDDSDGVLEPGETWTYTCAIVAGEDDIANTATVEATDDAGGTISDSDMAFVHVIHPDVELTKEADPTVVNIGDTVNYTITVENSGDANLTNVTVDDHLPGCALSGPTGDDGDGILEPGETWTYTCSITAGNTDIHNTATVEATDEAGGTVDDSDTASVDVIHPNVELTKEADPTVVYPGDTVDYTISVENTGDADLTNVTVDDDLPGCTLSGPSGDDGDGVLEPGETWTYTCSITAGNTDIHNTATVQATDEAGGTVGDSDTASVDVIHPDIELTKEANPTVVNPGDTVDYTISVENTGDANLTNVTVDDHLPGCTLSGPSGDDGDGVLEPGETWTYSCSITAGDTDIQNTATVQATDEVGGTVSDSDTATVQVKPLPTITSLSPVSATVGGPAFTLTVNGTNFVSGSVVQWGGSARTTTFVSNTRLTAAITAADIATAGTVNITVVNPPPGGGTSNALPFEIAEMSPEPPSIYIYMPIVFNNSSSPRHMPRR